VNNKYGIEVYAGAEPDISNCIFWENSDSDLFGCEARYSFVQRDIEPQSSRGLVAYWNFDEGSGDIANDSAGNNDGTIYGAQWTAGEIGNALNFDGVDDYVDFGTAIGNFGTDDFSVVFWFRTDTERWETIMGKRVFCGEHSFFELSMSWPAAPKHMYIELYDSRPSKVGSFCSNQHLDDNQWHYITIIRQGVEAKLYVDGVLDASNSSAEVVNMSNSASFLLGNGPCYPVHTDFFSGELDEVRIYNRALSTAEIRQLYRGQIGSDPLFADDENGDYHLFSQRGRYWPRADVWVLDKVTSPCVDGGDPNDDPADEPMPNGGRIDMGSFGGTPFASMSEIKWLDGDINHDGVVNLIDLAILAENWLRTGIGPGLPANYNWLSYNGHHYALTLQYGTWEQAEAEAVAVGGHLVTTNDAAENDWLSNFIKDSYTQGHYNDSIHNLAWIGLKYVGGDKNSRFSWRWVSQEPLSYWNADHRGIGGWTGTHMFLAGDRHPAAPGEWSCNPEHDTNPDYYPRGIIELPW
jgi:hypothetical protein